MTCPSHYIRECKKSAATGAMFCANVGLKVGAFRYFVLMQSLNLEYIVDGQ